MKMNMTLAAGAFILCTAAGANAAIFSDDFSSDTPGLNLTGLTNWTVASGNVDVVGAGVYPMYGSDNKVDMNGNTPGRIEHYFANLAAGTYKLSFDYGNNTGSNGVEQLSFGLGSFSGHIDIPGAIGSLISKAYTFSFAGGSASLFFADTGTSSFDNGGPILDNVSLVSAVPLPAGAPLLLAGLAGLAALRRRKSV